VNPARISPASQDNFDGSETRPARPGLVNFLRHLVSIMTPADRLLFFVLLGISLLSIFGVRLLLSNGRTASVIVNKRLIKTFSLAVDETYEITAAAGAVVLRVAGNGVQVARSNCPEKICVRQGRISRRGQVIVCVPNKLIVTVDGEIERPLDAITP
jgi:hypothetical protein